MPNPKIPVNKEPYSWAFNPIKLERAKKDISNLDEIRLAGTAFENKQEVMDELAAIREERVKARYIEIAGYIRGDKKARPRPPQAVFPGDDEDEE